VFAEPTYELKGYTFLRAFALSVDPASGKYELTLTLSNDDAAGADVRTARFADVAQLRLKEVGGGWTQFLYLAVEDRRADQHDRAAYEVRDVENDLIAFVCSEVHVSIGAPAD
jgi:hypothetical protein